MHEPRFPHDLLLLHTVSNRTGPLTGVFSDATFSPLLRLVICVFGGCVSGGSASGRFTPSSGSVRGVLILPLPPPPNSFDRKPPACVATRQADVVDQCPPFNDACSTCNPSPEDSAPASAGTACCATELVLRPRRAAPQPALSPWPSMAADVMDQCKQRFCAGACARAALGESLNPNLECRCQPVECIDHPLWSWCVTAGLLKHSCTLCAVSEPRDLLCIAGRAVLGTKA